MESNKTTSLIEALKEYNKSLSEQIKRIRSFIDEIDKQINQPSEEETLTSTPKIDTPFSKDYLVYKAKKNIN